MKFKKLVTVVKFSHIIHLQVDKNRKVLFTFLLNSYKIERKYQLFYILKDMQTSLDIKFT